MPAFVFAQQNAPRDITNESVKLGNGEGLRALIEEKTTELQRIHDERAKLEANIAETKAAQKGLNQEIGSINYSLRQLDLSIKSNRIVLEKLELEIEELRRDARLVERNVEEQKGTIAKLMFELYQKDKENVLMVFLRSGSLSEGVSEVQSILALQSDLAVGVQELRDFQTDLVRKAAETKIKQGDRERETKNLAYRGQIAQEEKQTKERLLAATKSQEKVYAAEIAKLDEQQTEISRVIDEIEAKLRETFDPTLLPVRRAGVLAYPVANPRVTQGYGQTPDAMRLYKSKTHNGVDYGVGVGTPVYATEDGVVRAVDNNDVGTLKWQKYQYGKYVLIDHPNSLSTLYAHLSRQVVSPGQEVKRGDVIGYSGNTGYSTGPHVHLTVFWQPSVQFKVIPPARGRVPVGITIDPEDYL